MDKQKLVEVLSVITALLITGCIIYSIVNKNWFDVVGLCAIFLGVWVLPAYFKKLRKNEKLA